MSTMFLEIRQTFDKLFVFDAFESILHSTCWLHVSVNVNSLFYINFFTQANLQVGQKYYYHILNRYISIRTGSNF